MAYPPKHSQCEQLFAELRRLDAQPGHEYDARKYEIIHDLAEGRFYEALPYFVEGLQSPDPDYRWACISALVTHWRYGNDQIVSKLLDLAETDPDEQVKQIAIDSLGILKVRRAVPLLRRTIEAPEDTPDIRKAAYLSLLRIVNFPEEEVFALWSNLDPASVNSDLLRGLSATSDSAGGDAD